MSIKYGDLIELGKHRLICGSSSDPEIIKKLVGDRKISLIVNDIPYGVAVVESKDSTSKTKYKPIINDQLQSDEEYQKFNREWLETIKPYLATKNSFYIFNCDKMVFSLKKSLDESGFRFCQLLIWIKNHAVMGRMDYLPSHELIVYGWVGSHKFYKSKDKSLLFFPKPQKSTLHPTMKPIPLIRHLILNSSQIGDYVFDGFLGSGTTLLAADQTKRKCLGVEIDPEYCQTIINRYQKLNKI